MSLLAEIAAYSGGPFPEEKVIYLPRPHTSNLWATSGRLLHFIWPTKAGEANHIIITVVLEAHIDHSYMPTCPTMHHGLCYLFMMVYPDWISL